MEARMTMCNMSIEAGARAGMVAPDETTYAYLKDRPHAPKGQLWDAAVAEWDSLRTDEGAQFDAEVHIDASTLTPFVTWGTNPGQGVPLGADVPDPELMADEEERLAAEKALTYMDLTPGTPCVRSRWTPCSSGPAPTGGSRTYGPSRTCCGTGRWPQGSPCSSFPAR